MSLAALSKVVHRRSTLPHNPQLTADLKVISSSAASRYESLISFVCSLGLMLMILKEEEADVSEARTLLEERNPSSPFLK